MIMETLVKIENSQEVTISLLVAEKLAKENKEIVLKIFSDAITWMRTSSAIYTLINLGRNNEIEFIPNNQYNGCDIALDVMNIKDIDMREYMIDVFVDIVFDAKNDLLTSRDLAIQIYDRWLEYIKGLCLKLV